MKPLRIDGARIPCAVCKDHWATAPAFHTVLCGRCLRAFFVGYMAGSNACSMAIYEKYDLKPKGAKE